MIEEKKRKEIVFEYAPMAITAIGIIVCAIAFQQKLIKTLPVLFSLMRKAKGRFMLKFIFSNVDGAIVIFPPTIVVAAASVPFSSVLI